MVAGSILALTPNITLINWHYAVWTPDGYIPQIHMTLWRKIAETPNTKIVLVLLRAEADKIMERREKDAGSGIKKRKIDIQCVREEIAATNQLFGQHIEILKSAEADWRSCVIDCDNDDLERIAQIVADTIEF